VTPNDNPSNAFWDNPSRDDPNGTSAPGCNVGYWLGNAQTWGQLLSHCQNDGSISNKPSNFRGPGPLDFYASSSSASRPVGWDFVASGDNIIDMTVEVAGWRTKNVLGLYTVSGGTRQYNSSSVIYDGSATPGSPGSKTLTLGTGVEFGFFLCANASTFLGCNPSTMLFSGDVFNSSTSTPRAGKFALFSENPTHPGPSSDITKYWVGVEDLAGFDTVEGRGDYNDIIFSATVAPRTIQVSEPGLYLTLAMDSLLFFLFVFAYKKGLIRRTDV
jgi:hypothetical protein